MRVFLCIVLLARVVAGQTSVVLLTDRAFDGRGGILRGARIAVENGRITSLIASPNGATIDLRGYTVLPGWIDTHVHLESHFDRNGNVAGRSEPAAEASLEIADNAWKS
ncbi:MAG TPA: hypothetical protein VNC18_20230, partial [Gemmatimonadaceae bacterium]|nr:hypothetical protein [Gemmatimonadaceae bacterium]